MDLNFGIISVGTRCVVALVVLCYICLAACSHSKGTWNRRAIWVHRQISDRFGSAVQRHPWQVCNQINTMFVLSSVHFQEFEILQSLLMLPSKRAYLALRSVDEFTRG